MPFPGHGSPYATRPPPHAGRSNAVSNTVKPVASWSASPRPAAGATAVPHVAPGTRGVAFRAASATATARSTNPSVWPSSSPGAVSLAAAAGASHCNPPPAAALHTARSETRLCCCAVAAEALSTKAHNAHSSAGRRRAAALRKVLMERLAPARRTQPLQLRRQPRRAAHASTICVPRASAAENAALAVAKSAATSAWFRFGVQGAVVLGLAALVDAGWSGDWSRIGAITTEDEAAARGIASAIGTFHLACAPLAALAASRRNRPVVPATAKTLLVGGLALAEAVLSDHE